MKELWKVIVIGLLLGATVRLAHADPLYVGLDELGLAKQNCQMIAEEIDANTTMGVLDVTFGDPRPCLKRLIATGKIVAIRVHLIDGTVSNHSCNAKENDIHYVASEIDKWKAFQDEYPAIKVFISIALEHGCTNKVLVERWYHEAEKRFDISRLICSYTTGYCPANINREMHGNTSKGPWRSNDGQSLFDADNWHYKSSAEIGALGWTNCMNGRVSGEHAPTPPPPPLSRQNWCSRAATRQAVRIMRDAPDVPIVTGCPPLRSPEISKTNAEYYGIMSKDPRGDKFLLISPVNSSAVDITDLSGHKKGFLKYYGPYQGNKRRYYIGTGSGQNPVTLMDQLGSEYGLLKAHGYCRVVNAIRRMGSFH